MPAIPAESTARPATLVPATLEFPALLGSLAPGLSPFAVFSG
jgi:hypothetical protein